MPRKIVHLNLHRGNRDSVRSNLVQLVLELYPTAAQISLVHCFSQISSTVSTGAREGHGSEVGIRPAFFMSASNNL